MAEIGIAVGGTALQIGGDILVALGKLWQHINPDNNPYTRKFIKVMNDLAIAVRDFIISAGSWFGKFLDLGGQAFIIKSLTAIARSFITLMNFLV